MQAGLTAPACFFCLLSFYLFCVSFLTVHVTLCASDISARAASCLSVPTGCDAAIHPAAVHFSVSTGYCAVIHPASSLTARPASHAASHAAAAVYEAVHRNLLCAASCGQYIRFSLNDLRAAYNDRLLFFIRRPGYQFLSTTVLQGNDAFRCLCIYGSHHNALGGRISEILRHAVINTLSAERT